MNVFSIMSRKRVIVSQRATGASQRAAVDPQDLCGAIRMNYSVFALENYIRREEDLITPDTKGMYPIHYACQNGNAVIVRFLLEKKVDPNQKSKRGLAPLFYAVCANSIETVEMLLSFGADPTITGDGDFNPLHFVCCDKDALKQNIMCDINRIPDSLVPRLLETGFFATKKEIAEKLITACVSEKWESMKALDHRDEYEKTPLQYAIYEKKLELIKLLVIAGADINSISNEGFTPLYEIILYKYDLDMVNFFIEWGADINLSGPRVSLVAPEFKFEPSPLYLAVWKKRKAIAHRLLDLGAKDFNIYPFKHDTVLHAAVHNEDPKLVRRLIATGMPLDVSASPDRSHPLFYAISYDYGIMTYYHRKIAKMLIENGSESILTRTEDTLYTYIQKLMEKQESGLVSLILSRAIIEYI